MTSSKIIGNVTTNTGKIKLSLPHQTNLYHIMYIEGKLISCSKQTIINLKRS